MELTASYDTDNKVIVVEARGPVTTENVKIGAWKALELSKKHDCYDLLFDLTNCRESQSFVQGFEAMNDMQKTTGLTHKHKCAVVYDPTIYSRERAQFIENVVATRPNPLLRVFTDRVEAAKWLKSKG